MNKPESVKKGQRWKYQESVIVEAERDSLSGLYGVALQSFVPEYNSYLGMNGITWCYSNIQDKTDWEYLEGQDCAV